MTDNEDDPMGGQEEPLVPRGGYGASRLNALRHGVLSKYTVLPWEDQREYQALLDELSAEHAPAGPTETHLVVELAGVLWRKRRLRLAEQASHHHGLYETTSSFSKTAQSALVLVQDQPGRVDVGGAIASGEVDIQRELVDLEDDRKRTLSAIEILQSKRNRAYDDALDILHDGTREAWVEQLGWAPDDYDDGVTPYTADAASLCRYLESEMLPWYDRQRAEVTAQPQVRAQALGESLDPDKLERLGRYEVHLDRKFERTLSTLLRLQEMRRTRVAQPENV